MVAALIVPVAPTPIWIEVLRSELIVVRARPVIVVRNGRSIVVWRTIAVLPVSINIAASAIAAVRVAVVAISVVPASAVIAVTVVPASAVIAIAVARIITEVKTIAVESKLEATVVAMVYELDVCTLLSFRVVCSHACKKRTES